MQKFWPASKAGRIATKNKTGFMFLDISGASQYFIEEAKTITGTVMDIGCAYGIVTLEVLKFPKLNVIAFDLSQDHLNILKQSVLDETAKKLKTIVGRFPNDFEVDDNSLDAIHCSYVFHFINGKETEKGLVKLYRALKPGGKLYVNTFSVYCNIFEKFLPVYKKNEKQGIKWPGEIYDLSNYVPEGDKENTPEFFHVYTKEIFEKALIETGFNVETCFYYDIKEPSWFASDGMGTIAAIAVKPNG